MRARHRSRRPSPGIVWTVVVVTRPAVRLAAASVLCATLVGCNGGSTLDADGVAILVGPPADATADALLSGILANVGGCLGVGDTVVIWPHGTRVLSKRPLTIDVPHVGKAMLGDSITLGGGISRDRSAGPRTIGDLDVGGVPVPAKCTSFTIWGAG